MESPAFRSLCRRVTIALGTRNTCVHWDDGQDHEDKHAVVTKRDLEDLILANQRLLDEVVRLAVVESVIDAVDAAIRRARQGHGDLNEAVLTRIVKTYREVLNSE